MMRASRGPAALLASLALAGCSLGPTEAQNLAQFDVDVVDAPAASSAFTGVLRLHAETEVSTDGVRWYTLGIIPTLAVLRLQRADSGATLHENGLVPAGVYRHARLVVHLGGYARVSGTFAGGRAADGDSVAVGVGEAPPLVVHRDFPGDGIRLARGATARFAWDVDAERWITAAALDARRSAPEAFADALTLVVP